MSNRSRSHVQVRRKGSSIVTPLAFIASHVRASFGSPVLLSLRRPIELPSRLTIWSITHLISMSQCQGRLWKWLERTSIGHCLMTLPGKYRRTTLQLLPSRSWQSGQNSHRSCGSGSLKTRWNQESATILLKESSDVTDLFLLEVEEGVDQLAWGMKKIAHLLGADIIEVGIDATCEYDMMSQ